MNLRALLTEHGISLVDGGEHRHVREGWLGIDCPWCGGQGKYHLGIHLSTLRASCWQCGRHSLAEVLERVLRVSAGEARRLVRGIPRRARTSTEAFQSRGKLTFPAGLRPLSAAARSYLRGRGFDPDHLVQLWGLHSIDLSAELSWRIWIPVHLDGEVVSWTTRAIGDKSRRYVNARPEQETLPIKSLLYGWDYVRHSVIVCEGPTDAWRIGPGAVATFGLVATTSQLLRLCSIPRRIVVFDNEPAAQRTARRLCEQLQSHPGETILARIDADDPGSASDEEVAELRSYLE